MMLPPPRPRQLVIASAVALIGAAAALSGIAPVWRAVAVLPLALFVPGFALSHLLLGPRLTPFERSTFSFGFSLACLILIGLGLQVAGELSPAGWAVALAGVTVLCGLLAGTQAGPDSTGTAFAGLRPRHVAIMGIALGLTVGAVIATRTVALGQQTATAFSQLWMLSQDQGSSVLLGIRSHETVPARFTLQLEDAGATVKQWPDILLQPGETWETSVALPETTGQRFIEAALSKNDDPTQTYRHVSAWIQRDR